MSTVSDRVTKNMLDEFDPNDVIEIDPKDIISLGKAIHEIIYLMKKYPHVNFEKGIAKKLESVRKRGL